MKLMQYFTKSRNTLRVIKETENIDNDDRVYSEISNFFNSCWNDMNNIIDNSEAYTINFIYPINNVCVLNGLKAFKLQDCSDSCYEFQKSFGDFVKKVKLADLQCRIMQDDYNKKFNVVVDIFEE